MFKTRFISMLVLLAAVATGAWAQDYTITLPSVEHGSVVAKVNNSSVTSAAAGTTVSLVATPDAGYRLKSISGVYETSASKTETLNATAATVNGTIFKAVATARNNSGWRVYNPGSANTLTISSKDGTTIKKIELTSTFGGSRRNNMLSVTAGTLSFDGSDPSTTFTINNINATSVIISGSGNNAGKTWCISSAKIYYEAIVETALEISDTENANVKTFTMPSNNVTVSAEFESAVVAGYSVALKDGTEDATSWTIAPAEATTTGVAAGTTVTATYSGTKKVKSVKAVKKAKPAATVTTAPTATTGDIVAGSETALVSGGAATGGTMMYKVTTENTQPTSTEGFSADVPTAKTLAAGTYYVWYYVQADATHTDSEISATAIAVTVKAATVLSGALVDGAIIKVNFKWRGYNSGDYVQGTYNADSGTFTVSMGGGDWGTESSRAVYKVEKSGNNIIIGAGFFKYTSEGMVWTFNTTNDTYTTTNGDLVNDDPGEYGLISVTLNGTDITSQLTKQ